MRRDMKRVIVGRPRKGSWKGYRDVRSHVRDQINKELKKQEWDDAGWAYESMTAHYGYDLKSFNDHTQPLRRALEKSVGRKFDDVVSEIVDSADPRSMLGDHLVGQRSRYGRKFGHVFDSVDDGTENMFSYSRREFTREKPLIVDEHGYLRRNPRYEVYRKRYQLDRPDDGRVIDAGEDREYRVINGRWHLVVLRPLTKNTKLLSQKDFNFRAGTATDALGGDKALYPPRFVPGGYRTIRRPNGDYWFAPLPDYYDYNDSWYASFARELTPREIEQLELPPPSLS